MDLFVSKFSLSIMNISFSLFLILVMLLSLSSAATLPNPNPPPPATTTAAVFVDHHDQIFSRNRQSYNRLHSFNRIQPSPPPPSFHNRGRSFIIKSPPPPPPSSPPSPSCGSFPHKTSSRSFCIQFQRMNPLVPPSPPGDDQIDPRYGVEKRLVPSGPNPLHN